MLFTREIPKVERNHLSARKSLRETRKVVIILLLALMLYVPPDSCVNLPVTSLVKNPPKNIPKSTLLTDQIPTTMIMSSTELNIPPLRKLKKQPRNTPKNTPITLPHSSVLTYVLSTISNVLQDVTLVNVSLSTPALMFSALLDLGAKTDNVLINVFYTNCNVLTVALMASANLLLTHA